MEYKRLDRKVKVTDDWYSTYEDGTIKLSLMIVPRFNFVRMCAWGADDCGYEIDFKSKNNKILEGCFESWKLIFYSISDNVDKHFFMNMGMHHA